MKILFLLAFASILLASCGKQYGDTIEKRFTSNQCNFLTADELKTLTPGMQSIAPPDKDGTFEVCDSFYTVPASLRQKYQLAAHGHGLIVFYLLIALAAISVYLGYRKSQNQKTSSDSSFLLYFFLALALLAGAYGAIDWAHTKEIDIPKPTYVDPAALKTFWDENLYL